MSDNSRRKLTGAQRLRWRIILANICTGLSIVLWLIPIGLLSTNISHNAYLLIAVFTATFSLGSFLSAFALRAALRHCQWREEVNATALRRHNELVRQIAADDEAMMRLINAGHQVSHNENSRLAKRLDEISGKLDRDAWEIYSDGQVDKLGGPEVVHGQVTTKLHEGELHMDHNVVHLPRASNWRS
jgi:hypothetical protein